MKNKKGMIYAILLMTCLVIGLSYGAFIFSTDKYRSSELLISKLNYSIDIQEDGSNKSTINGSSVTVPASTKVYLNITLTSVNEIDSKYTLAYKTSTNAKVQYSDRTPWNTQGVIKGIDSNTYSKKIRVVIDNTNISTPSTVNFQVYGGYSFNSYANIELTDGYVSVSGPYTEVATNIGNRLVDIIESDTSCLTSNSNTCLYGGENIKNYVQYPENEDKTKNLWRIIGSYQIDDQTLPKLISQSTSSTSTSTLTTDLTSFYNTLEDKEVLVQETNKFNCFTNTCAESTYNNIGLLTDYEYNQIGGVNSYLATTEKYYINSSSGIKEVTSSGITNPSNTSGLKPTIYLQTGVQVTGSGTVSDPYIISPASDINLVAYTLNGQATDKNYADLLKTNVVDKVTCKNGTTASWNYEENSMKLSNIKTPDYCTINFKDGYSVSLSAGSTGTVSAPTTQSTGYNGTVSFTVTSNTGSTELTKNTCNGVLSGSTFTISNVKGSKSCEIEFSKPTLANKLLMDNITIVERSNITEPFYETNGDVLFYTTESIAGGSAETVYYFAGDNRTNWVKFGTYQAADSEGKWSIGDDIYWRIIRTNHDGSIRLLYAGSSPNTTNGYIGKFAFSKKNDDPMYAGYIYGSSGTLEKNRLNVNNSTIKGVIDTWYNNSLSDFSDYISQDAVYCNDRNVGSGNYGLNSEFNYLPYTRLDIENSFASTVPTYDCANIKDAFSGNNTEAQLTYPIGLMTADEIIYAGANIRNARPPFWFHLNSDLDYITGVTNWWTMSPARVTYTGTPGVFTVGYMQGFHVFPQDVTSEYAIRPVISLNADVQWSRGDGSPENPYEIVYN